ncbi:hypothetical protein LSH36_37g12040 [Paralvinella palmiformis]|uniref:Uncharacterized protein n=1 Tax=Paralvinella palmiformis TaxID=53620 RepID=A0AAD9NFR4_9ANNE|nr:hypothetical protein LSH36_37g12040 [Paralvinella palmiformis]
MIPDITRCYLVLVTLIIHLSRHVTCDVICTNYTLPSRCTCSDGEGQPTKVTCVDAGLTSLPPVLPPAVDLVIENNTIDVIAHVSYGPTVRYLYLNRNKIQLIRNGAFRNLTNLETLSLASNELTSLRQETFFGLNILKTLILVGNPVYVLRVDTFDGNVLPRLENLDLDNCNLFEVEDGAVDGLPNLMFLTLSNNRLRRHPLLGCTRSSLTSLTTFDVSHNEISEIRRGSCRLPSLRNLNFSNNNIRALNASFFGTSTTSLGALYLRNNGLTFVDVDAFKGCRNLTVLDISHNRLTSLDNRTIQWGQIKSVIVGENPWHCDCGNMWLIEENAVKEYNADDAVR